MKTVVMNCLIALGILASAPSQATHVLIDVERYVHVGDINTTYDGPNSHSLNVGFFSDFISHDIGVDPIVGASASQISNIDDVNGEISGSGSASIDFSALADDDPFAESVTLVNFDLLTPHAFSAIGAATAFMDGGLGLAGYELFGPGGFAVQQFAIDNDTISINDSFLLGPGSYLFAFGGVINNSGAQGFLGGNVSYDLSFSLREAPEPGSLALMGVAVLAVGAARRGRRPTR